MYNIFSLRYIIGMLQKETVAEHIKKYEKERI